MIARLETSKPATLSLLEAAEKRRTVYTLLPTSKNLSNAGILSMVEQTILTTPSAYNSQTARVVVLFGSQHRALWDLTEKALINKLGEERFVSQGTKTKITNFRNGYGTVMFFDDGVAVDGLVKIAGDRAYQWVDETNGMHQYVLWTALASSGLGANLQHYNPIIDEEVKKAFNIPQNWTLKAELVFGDIPKQYSPIEKVQKSNLSERLLVFGDEE